MNFLVRQVKFVMETDNHTYRFCMKCCIQINGSIFQLQAVKFSDTIMSR